jgi:hypothetical protein
MRALLVSMLLVTAATALAQETNRSSQGQCRSCAPVLKTCLDACGSEDCSERCRRDHHDYDCEAVCPQQKEGRMGSGQTRDTRLVTRRLQRLQAAPIVASSSPELR